MDIWKWRITRKNQSTEAPETFLKLSDIQALLAGAGLKLETVIQRATLKAQKLFAGAEELKKLANTQRTLANAEYAEKIAAAQLALNACLAEVDGMEQQAAEDELIAGNLGEILSLLPSVEAPEFHQ